MVKRQVLHILLLHAKVWEQLKSGPGVMKEWSLWKAERGEEGKICLVASW